MISNNWKIKQIVKKLTVIQSNERYISCLPGKKYSKEEQNTFDSE